MYAAITKNHTDRHQVTSPDNMRRRGDHPDDTCSIAVAPVPRKRIAEVPDDRVAVSDGIANLNGIGETVAIRRSRNFKRIGGGAGLYYFRNRRLVCNCITGGKTDRAAAIHPKADAERPDT